MVSYKNGLLDHPSLCDAQGISSYSISLPFYDPSRHQHPCCLDLSATRTVSQINVLNYKVHDLRYFVIATKNRMIQFWKGNRVLFPTERAKNVKQTKTTDNHDRNFFFLFFFFLVMEHSRDINCNFFFFFFRLIVTTICSKKLMFPSWSTCWSIAASSNSNKKLVKVQNKKYEYWPFCFVLFCF